MMTLALPPEARIAAIRAAFRRLGDRTLVECTVADTAQGLVWWGPDEIAPASAFRLATRLGELLPEAASPVGHFVLPDDAAALEALGGADATWPDLSVTEPSGEALVALRRSLLALPPEGWIRQAAIVSVRPGVKARVVARRLLPDHGVVARALAGAAGPPGVTDEATLGLLDPLLLSHAARLLAPGEGEGRLFVPLAPAVALGGDYDALEAVAGRQGIARLVPALALAEAVAAPAHLTTARARFAADGQRLQICCPGPEALALLACLLTPSDILGLTAETARAAASAGVPLATLGPERIILSACAAEEDIVFGLGHGIGLYEGRVVEALLASRRAAA
ncbi:hypothetical protein [Elioraea sp.]|uniref:hypothetical protein n=1 Tax=Elioraea sp. TaxID=2185103 RepID=UPI0025BAC712|nr:hypothetical protein [Elioraea sp.]